MAETPAIALALLALAFSELNNGIRGVDDGAVARGRKRLRPIARIAGTCVAAWHGSSAEDRRKRQRAARRR